MEKSRSTYFGFLVIVMGILEGVQTAHPDPKGVIVTDDLTEGIRCQRNTDRYHCLKTCEPSDDPSDPGGSPPVDPSGTEDGRRLPPNIGQEPPENEPGYPTVNQYIEILSTAVTPVTIYLNENNDVTIDMDIQFDTPFTVSGRNMWEASLWFSKYADGSGSTKTNLIDATLTDKQKNRRVKPDTSLSFLELDQNVDLTDGSDCGKYKYICGEIRKDNPNPDFVLEERTRHSSRGCAKVTCKDRGSGIHKTVQFESVAPTGVQLYVGEQNIISTDVTVTFNEETTDPTTAGESLWQMSMWFSKDSDGFGSATGLVSSTLTQDQIGKPVDNFNDFILEDVAITVDLRDAEGCGKFKYICARMRKGDPTPDYEILGKNKGAKTGCSPVKCKVRGAPEEGEGLLPFLPEDGGEGFLPFAPDEPSYPFGSGSIIEVISTTTTPVNLYLDEVNDVTTDVDIVFDTDANIKGTDLWQMSIWFSKQRDGSGKQTNLRESVLSSRQRSKSVKPDKDLTYVELSQSVDLTDGSACGKFKYICSELRKHNPTPDFKLRDRQKFSRRGCARVTCSVRGNDDLSTVQFRSTQPTPVTLYIGESNDVNTNVAIKFKEKNTDPNTAGEALWQMSLWFSKSENGIGSSTGYIKSTLNQDQGSKSVDFNIFVMEQLPITADLTDALGCGKYKYICARIRKDDPEPDYKLIGKDPLATTGCARVTCETRGPEDQKLEIVSTSPSPITLYRNERNPVTTDVTVDFDADFGASGSNLWQMSLWFSKQPDASGKRTNLKESVLNRENRNKPLNIEEPLVFKDLPQSVDLSGGQRCGKYKYICAEIRKFQPVPNFDFSKKKKTSTVGCASVICIDREVTTPTVQFQSVEPTPITLYLGEENQVTTDVLVQFDRDNTDEDVAGDFLWGLSVWFSKAKDGVGSSTGAVSDALNQIQRNKDVDFNDFEFNSMEMTADLTSVGCGKYRFICARIRKGLPSPNYNLVGPKSVSGCAPVTCEKRGEPEPEPLVIVSTSISPVTIYVGEEITVFPDVTIEFEGEDGVSGTNLWEMSLYFTKNGDGSGKQTSLAESTLTQSQKNQPLIITENLVFEEIEKDVDMTQALGCGKYKYICAVIRKDNPSPDFEYKKKKPSSIRGCAKTSCEVRETPEPTVQFASTQPTGVTIYMEELNVVNTDVVVTFNEPNTDPTVAGTDLWQMQLWFSKSDTGSGSSIGLLESALTEEQADQPVNFIGFSFVGLEARADLTTLGCTKFQYICSRVRRDSPDPSYKLVGKVPTATTGCAPVICERGRDPTVQFASVTNTPVTIYEESETTVTTTVSVTFDEENTDESVSGSSLWQVTLWFSKGADGLGSSSDEVSNALSAPLAGKPVNFNTFVFDDLEITSDLRDSNCGKYRYICAQIRRDNPDPAYKLLGKERDATVGCSEVTCDRSPFPTVEIISVSTSGVSIYEDMENPVTTSISVTFNEDTTDPAVSGSNLWQVKLWFSKAEDGLGSSSDAVESALSSQQGAQPVDFNNFVFEDLSITADLTITGCGKYRFICGLVRRDDPEPAYHLLGETLSFRTGCAPVTCERFVLPIVTVASVTNTPVTISPEENNQGITTDVTVTFNAAETESISGTGLWRLETYYSKLETGAGFRSSETSQSLSVAQSNLALSGNSLQFTAASADADLSGTGCGKYLFICAKLKKGEPTPDYEFEEDSSSASVGCSPVECGQAPVETPHITPISLDVTSTEVTVGRPNNINIDVSIDFDPADTDDVSGTNLWKIIVWLSDQNDGFTGSRVSETEQTITRAHKAQSLTAPGPLAFSGVRVNMDLTSEKCKKIAYVCARLKKEAPEPNYTMAPKSVTGCAPCQCNE